MSFKSKLILLFFSIALIISCSDEKNNSGYELSGSWKANWYLSDENLETFFTSDQMNMQGEVNFINDKQVSIKAYGFNGCAFTPDTTVNQLYYRIDDSLFNLVNHSDEIIFSYLIQERRPGYIRMLLMDDIQLTLIR